MKIICVLLTLLLLFSGCVASQPEAAEADLPVMVIEETTPPTTETVPMDPLQQIVSGMTVEERVG